MNVITKRLHISGLSENISKKDLEGRFASFGTVKALDGVGLRDGNGDLRRFAYVTLSGTQSQVSKCLNVLSGATWKGTKLRVGEAKPDYKERIAKENADQEADDEITSRPKKRRRLARGVQGVHAADMSPITADNCLSRSGGWVKTPLGRLVRPMRMRPVRPLPTPVAAATKSNGEKSKTRKKKRKEQILTRARRKLINPLHYGSEYIKGVLLVDGGTVLSSDRSKKTCDEGDSRSTQDEEVFEDAMASSDESDEAPVALPPVLLPTTLTSNILDEETSILHSTSTFVDEAKKGLSLLGSLFGSVDNDDEWGGQELLSDDEVDQSRVPAVSTTADRDGDFEVVPRDGQTLAKRVLKSSILDAGEEDIPMIVDDASAEQVETKQPQSQTTKLKDMFVVREEDAGFSVFGNLELDLELDDANDVQAAPLTQEYLIPKSFDQRVSSALSTSHVTPASRVMNTFEPNRTLFFPLQRESLNDNTRQHRGGKGRFKDIYEVLQEKDWLGAPPFACSESEEEIRKGWEERKGDLTREWKKRFRDAVKSSKKRGGFVGELD